jgi:hypothetical protein
MHDVVPYISAGADKSAALTGQRLAVIGFKGGDIKSQCVSIPELEVSEDEYVQLKPYVIAWLQGEQDKLIRAAIITGARTVATSQIDVISIMEALDVESESSRLTKDMISTWFDASLSAPLADALRAKAPQATPEQIAGALTGYKDKIASLSGGRVSMSEDVLVLLGKALAYCGAGDVIGARLSGKVANMVKKLKEDAANMMFAL